MSVRRFVSLASAVLAVGLALAQGAAPALASGITIYVGSCHSGGLPDLYAAVAAANNPPAATSKTVIICPGVHMVTVSGGALTFTTNNLVVKGKTGAVVETEPDYSGKIFDMSAGTNVTLRDLTIRAGTNYSGAPVDFSSATNARVQKVVINGQGNVNAASVGIRFFGSSGWINANKVLNWHSPVYDGSQQSTAIEAGGGGVVHINGNTVDSFEGTGISAEGLQTVGVTNNKVVSPPGNTSGIIAILIGLLTDAKVTGNKVTGGAYPASNSTVGLKVDQASNVRVIDNRISNWDTGILVIAGCIPDFTADNLLVRSNRIQDSVSTGIEIDSPGSGCDTSADHAVVIHNRFINSGAAGSVAINLAASNDGVHFGYARNVRLWHNHLVNFSMAALPLNLDPPYVTGIIGPNL